MGQLADEVKQRGRARLAAELLSCEPNFAAAGFATLGRWAAQLIEKALSF